MTRNTLNRIFYIYSDASAAVFMAACSLVELACFFAVPRFFEWLCFSSFLGFGAIAVCLAARVYRDAKKSNLI